MQLKVSPEVAVLYLTGTVHRETADEVDAAFDRALSSEAKCIILSFQDVKALLSDGIRLLITLCDKAHQAGKTFHITDLPKEVRYALQITNLLNLLGHSGYTLNLLQEKNVDPQKLRPVELIYTRSIACEDLPSDVSPAPALVHRTPSAAPAAPRPPARPPARPAPAQTERPKPSSEREVPGRSKLLSEQELTNCIRNHFPGRNELRIAEYMSRVGVNVKSLDEIIAALRADKSTISTAMKRLMSRGTIKAVGGGLFNYSGSEDLRTALTQIAAMLQKPDTHSTTLKLLMNAEKH